MSRKAFFTAVKKLREVSGLSLYEAAQLLNTGAGTISRWENNIAAPPTHARDSIVARLFEVALDKIS